MTGSSVRYLEIFKALCGAEALPNVFLITTHWDDLKDETIGYKRDTQLRDHFWRPMVDLGSSVREFRGSPDDALGIVMDLVSKPCVELDIQRRLIQEQTPFALTPAGQLAMPAIASDLTEMERQISLLEALHTASGTTTPTTNGLITPATSSTIELRREAERKRNVLRRLLS
ncbi:hypothetical protein QBC37DRAFT_407073 [Rhypophila decipiens]|uniref:Uncharacterized protein n=1 Tax=Rhypophila decipiens TaxID=261697 RepID=A0AAN6XTM4_9PEZI|nr:hypothetical protein QBC37DRAFT_407073 [Rhypophila decipiens]